MAIDGQGPAAIPDLLRREVEGRLQVVRRGEEAGAVPLWLRALLHHYAYSGLTVKTGDTIAVSFTVKNTGKRAGTEIAQVYASLPDAAGEPPKRLIGWARVELAAGESKIVTIPVESRSLDHLRRNNGCMEACPRQLYGHGGRFLTSSAAPPADHTAIEELNPRVETQGWCRKQRESKSFGLEENSRFVAAHKADF